MQRLFRAAVAALVVSLSVALPASARPDSFAPGFATHVTSADGRAISYHIGGKGPVVLLLHGYGDTGHMWAPLATRLARDHQVIVPDLPGLGESRPQGADSSYAMAPVARSIHTVLSKLHVRSAAVVGHDIGLMAAYAYAAQYPAEVTKLALMDAPIPGVGPWTTVLLNPAIWHFHFYGKYAEQLTAGRERIYLNRLWDAFAFHPERVTEATRAYYAASYAQPGNMHAGFSYFAAFDKDAAANVAFARTPLTMPVLAMGGAKSFGALEPEFARAVATNVETSVIPDAGHWLMDENPRATIDALVAFLR